MRGMRKSDWPTLAAVTMDHEETNRPAAALQENASVHSKTLYRGWYAHYLTEKATARDSPCPACELSICRSMSKLSGKSSNLSTYSSDCSWRTMRFEMGTLPSPMIHDSTAINLAAEGRTISSKSRPGSTLTSTLTSCSAAAADRAHKV